MEGMAGRWLEETAEQEVGPRGIYGSPMTPKANLFAKGYIVSGKEEILMLIQAVSILMTHNTYLCFL